MFKILEAPRRVSVAPIPDDFLDPLSLINLFNQKRPSSRQHGLPDARLLRPSGRNPLLRGIFFLRSLRPRSSNFTPNTCSNSVTFSSPNVPTGFPCLFGCWLAKVCSRRWWSWWTTWVQKEGKGILRHEQRWVAVTVDRYFLS